MLVSVGREYGSDDEMMIMMMMIVMREKDRDMGEGMRRLEWGGSG